MTGPLDNARHERFYVYVVRIDGRTRYVGKGCGRRARVHLTASHNPTLRAEIDAARATGRPVRSRIIAAGLTERDAYRLERRSIAKWADKTVNVSLGSHTSLELLAMECRANLATLKTEAQVRREGPRMGVSVDSRVAYLRRIRASLERMAAA